MGPDWSIAGSFLLREMTAKNCLLCTAKSAINTVLGILIPYGCCRSESDERKRLAVPINLLPSETRPVEPASQFHFISSP